MLVLRGHLGLFMDIPFPAWIGLSSFCWSQRHSGSMYLLYLVLCRERRDTHSRNHQSLLCVTTLASVTETLSLMNSPQIKAGMNTIEKGIGLNQRCIFRGNMTFEILSCETHG